MSNRVARGLAVAAAGLFAGHILVYRIVAPDASQPASPGVSHAYLPLALAVGLLAAVAAGAGAFLLGYRRGTAPDSRRPGPGLIATLVLPAVAQAVAFVALEVLERALAGVPIGSLVGPLLSVGVALQLVVGAAGGLLLAGLDRAGELTGRAVAGCRHPLRRDTEAHPWPPATPGPIAAPRRSLGIRGPPVLA
ncbi:MAG: hypothetical protein QOH66_565 [Actinomycetota bacterium]|jgi:hypothetical protein|nr:hypothetical protein [Actinomycetota bacterium]MEA2587638.1 hypothetical protein [Actinomycetota bacterium]